MSEPAPEVAISPAGFEIGKKFAHRLSAWPAKLVEATSRSVDEDHASLIAPSRFSSRFFKPDQGAHVLNYLRLHGREYYVERTEGTRSIGFAKSGVKGLDYILEGGFPRNRVYLVEGHPGSGKTTLGLQFLREGLEHGETALCISLSENREELELVARSHGWSLEGIEYTSWKNSKINISRKLNIRSFIRAKWNWGIPRSRSAGALKK